MEQHDLNSLTPDQSELVNRPFSGSVFLTGPAGTGKTTVGVFRMLNLIDAGNYPASILVLVPQRRLGEPYLTPGGLNGQMVEHPEVVTLAGLARRTVELFWPLIGHDAGFKNPADPPRFLTLETSQYYMSRIIGPYLDEGCFESLSLDRHQLFRQILDNLNKAAVVGFPIAEIGTRLSESWAGPEGQTQIYDQAQHCAELFRTACYENNLVDFSLQYKLFFEHVELLPAFREYFAGRYTHMIADNVEEQTPREHDFVAGWLPELESSLIIADEDGGYSRFLGADPNQLEAVRSMCKRVERLDTSLIMSESIEWFSLALQNSISKKKFAGRDAALEQIEIQSSKFLPDLVNWVGGEIDELVQQGVSPSQIAIVSPFVSDTLRFLLTHQLERRGIPWVSHRPSRAIADEEHNRCLLTLAAIAHPAWEIVPAREKVAQAFMLAIEGLDLIRASLLANTVYRTSGGLPELSTFMQLRSAMQERIGYHLGEKYEGLQSWVASSIHSKPLPLDQFMSKLFGEVLSQPGYGFHDQMDAARSAAAMITSIQKFRLALPQADSDTVKLGREYYKLIADGLLAAQYRATEEQATQDAVFISPAFTYLSMNRTSSVQFWLDIGNPAWAERLYQPLTHPYVLSRSWQRGQQWTDQHEQSVRREIVGTLTTGLARRCKQKIYLCQSAFGEQGLEQRGVLLSAVQQILSKAVG